LIVKSNYYYRNEVVWFGRSESVPVGLNSNLYFNHWHPS
jgi:hypothetical protein